MACPSSGTTSVQRANPIVKRRVPIQSPIRAPLLIPRVGRSDLPQVFRAVMKQHNLAPGDFPDLEPFRAKLSDTNFIKFPKLKMKMLEDLDEVCRRSSMYLCVCPLCEW